LLFEFFDFALDEVALEHAEMLQEEDAVEVIDFVAEGRASRFSPRISKDSPFAFWAFTVTNCGRMT
jgi:hypothetical protein